MNTITTYLTSQNVKHFSVEEGGVYVDFRDLPKKFKCDVKKFHHAVSDKGFFITEVK